MSNIEVVQTATGRMLVDRRDKWIGGSYLALGEYSYAEAQAIRHYCKPGTVALDIGANIGAVAVEMSAAVGPAGVVVACEPQFLVWQLLVGNVALNGLRNVLPLNVACGREPGYLMVPDLLDGCDGEVNSGGLELGGAAHAKGRKTQVVTIDSLCLPATPVSLIKIDVEGMEGEVLRGATETLKKHRPVVYFEIDRPNWNEPVEILHRAGYRIFTHQPPLYREDNHAGAKSPWSQHIVSCNAIGIPAEKFEYPPFEHGVGEINIKDKVA